MSPLPFHTAVIAFGSNLGNSIDTLRQAYSRLLAEDGIQHAQISSLYRTTPVGYTNQPDFINAVALVQTTLNAQQMLNVLQQIEHLFGRERSFRYAPRTLDLDLIDFNHEILNTESLILPHPRAHERSFVMQPLAEIAPHYCLGKQTISAQQWATQLNSDGIQKLNAV